MSKAMQVLAEEYHKIGGRIFADYFLRNHADDETKKSIQANDFLLGMMNGNLKVEWKLGKTQDYKDLVEVAAAINLLSKEKK